MAHEGTGALKEFFPSWPLGAEVPQLGTRPPGGRLLPFQY